MGKENDITIIYLTASRVPEQWMAYQQSVLKKATAGMPIISVSMNPIEFGDKHIIQEGEPCIDNIYWNMLKAAKMTDTPFVAVAEDDVLYPREHFTKFRPPLDTFAYNYVRWQFLTWNPIMFHWRPRMANYALIAPRELLIKGLEERFAKYPLGQQKAGGELGYNRFERKRETTQHKTVEFGTTVGLVALNHINGIDPLEQKQKKRMGFIRAIELPHWGSAKELIKKFNGSN